MRDRTLGLLAGISFVVFLALAVAVTYSAALDAADLQAAIWVNHLVLGDLLNSVLVAASLYGREYFWVAVVAVMFLAGDRRTKLLALGLSAVFIVGIVGGEVTKDLVARPRPESGAILLLSPHPEPLIRRLPVDTDFSFPSGHALIVSVGAFYTLATFRRKWVAALLTVEAAIVWFSRVYVGAHYPTDVVAGVALGAAIAFGGLAVEKRYLRTWGDRIAGYLVRALREGPFKA